MKITDNFLYNNDYDHINKTFHLSNFPWYFMPFMVHEGDDNYQFYHLFEAKGQILSKYFEILHPILKKLSVKEIIRIKANLKLKQKEHIQSDIHIDFKDCKTAIFYLNTNNGYTLFDKGDKIPSQENRVVEFDSNLKYCALNQADFKYRIVINFNYL
tara:strand:+ start:658 stop:1128 length:471 start_codon:yes stop_codon:yes gene_type:complete